MLPLRPVVALIVAVALGAAARAEVLTVGPLGSDFNAIDAAVAAAADGDIVLVRTGAYAQFVIDDKSVTVVAESPGAVLVTGQVRVQNLAKHRRVALIDLSVTGNGENALLLWGNAGSVRVRGGTWRGTDLGSPYGFRNSAIEAVDCQDVAVRDCVLVGGRGADSTLAGGLQPPGAGGDALEATNTRLALHRCTLTGGDGGSDVVEEGYDGGHAGDGLQLAGGFVFACDSTFQGGDGGAGGEEDGIPPFWNEAGRGGNGGHGLRLVGTSLPVQAELLAVTANGGLGGPGGLGYWGPNGQPGADGQPVALFGSATANTLPYTARNLSAPGLWHATSSITLQVRGDPGELVFLATSPSSGFAWLPDRKGVSLLGGPPVLRYLGQLDPQGKLDRTFVPGEPPGGAEGGTFELQALVVSPLTGVHLTGSLTTARVASSY